jgi:hypothetical protein
MYWAQDLCQHVPIAVDLVRRNLAEYTKSSLAVEPLTERAQIRLGRKPYPGQ